jgi:branched-chain amino acid aminotransferase
MELASKELGLDIIERPIDRTEVYLCEEFFMTGTAAQVTAATKIDHRSIGDGKMGPLTSKLRDIFNEVVRGKHEDYKDWLHPVF